MRGMLFGLVRESLERQFGPQMWEQVLLAGDANGHNALGHSDELSGFPSDLPSDALICWLGRQAVPMLAQRHPSLFDRHEDLTSFVCSLGDSVPTTAGCGEMSGRLMEYYRTIDGDLLVTINGPDRICSLIAGLISGAAEHYGEAAVLEELKCRRHGDNRCILRVAIAAEDVAAEHMMKVGLA